MTRKTVFILSIVLLAASCKPQVNLTRSTIEFVREILSDKDNTYRSIFPSEPDPKGEICLIGSKESCVLLSEFISECDSRENVDGSHKSDGLPDFAGETVSSIILPESSSTRDAVVRTVLASLDTVYHVSPYDLEGIGRRNAAKVIVLTDVGIAEHGKFDVDTLFSAMSCGIPVISPFELMLSKVFAGRDHSADVGVICNPEAADTMSYSAVALEYAKENGLPDCRCTVFTSADSVDVLYSFFDNYLKSGETKPLDAIFIDNADVNMDDINESLSAIMDLSRPESMKYGRLLCPGFRILESGATTAEECFNLLRARNCFTHKISFPRCGYFDATDNPGKEDGSVVLIPKLNVQD